MDGTVERELHACQVELITDVCGSAGEAVGRLGGLRRAVVATRAGLLGSGTHPSASEGEAEITDKERHERIHDLLGDAVATPVGGLHVQIGMPDADTAIPVSNGLRVHLPLLQALAANSASLVALTHCLARPAADAPHPPDPRAEILEEGAFRAARFGVAARLPDAEVRLRPVPELRDGALSLARPHADELNCADQLEALPQLAARGGGAGAQRAVHEIAGMDALLRELTEVTAAGAAV